MLVGIGYFGWIIAALVFSANGLRDGSLRVISREATLDFRKRTGGRVFGAMMCAWLVAFVPLIYWMNADSTVQHQQTAPMLNMLDYVSILGLLWLTGASGGLMLYLLAGPNDLFLDLNRRTYRFVSGWPVFPQVQTGPWEDMAGVYVRRVSGRGGECYLVGIAWRQEKRSFPLLGRFRREEDAEALAKEVSASLGLPRVLPPPPGKTAVDPVSQRLPTPLVTHPYRPFQSTLFSEDVAAEPKPDK